MIKSLVTSNLYRSIPLTVFLAALPGVSIGKYCLKLLIACTSHKKILSLVIHYIYISLFCGGKNTTAVKDIKLEKIC